MTFFADLHVHSKYSRATSRDCDLEHLSHWAQKKGLALVGTGDFTHPGWARELAEKLVPAEPGLYRLRPDLEREVARTVALGLGHDDGVDQAESEGRIGLEQLGGAPEVARDVAVGVCSVAHQGVSAPLASALHLEQGGVLAFLAPMRPGLRHTC